MSDEIKPTEAVEAPKVESEAPKVEATETPIKPEASENAAAPKEESAVTGAEKTEVKSEEIAKVEKEESPEKNGDSKTERNSRSASPYTKRQRDDRSRSPRNDRRNNDRRGRGRDDRNGGDRKGYQNYNNNKKDNIKSVYALAESSDADEIRKQVEFYFSDSNLCQDKFLFTQTGGTDNKPIPISVIHSFKRMRHFQPFSAVVAALKESKTLEVVNDDEVKRKTPLPIDKDVDFEDSLKLIEDAAMARSIYAKGFGSEESTTQLDIEEFFEPYGPINMIKLRRDFHDNTFKGSVFVEFRDPEVMQNFMEMEDKPQWKGKDLKFQTKKAYCEGKIEDIKAGKIRPNEHDTDRSSFRGRGGGRGRGDRGRGRGRGGRGNNDRRDRDGGRRSDRDGDDRDWKTRRDNDQRKDRRQRSASPKAAVDDRFVDHSLVLPSFANKIFSEAFQSSVPARHQPPSLPTAKRRNLLQSTRRSAHARMMPVKTPRPRKSRPTHDHCDDRMELVTARLELAYGGMALMAGCIAWSLDGWDWLHVTIWTL